MNKIIRKLTPRSRITEPSSMRSSQKRLRGSGRSMKSTKQSPGGSKQKLNHSKLDLSRTRPIVPLIKMNKLREKGSRIKRAFLSTRKLIKTQMYTQPLKLSARLTLQEQLEQHKLPLRAEEVLEHFSESITQHEREEVRNYAEIYYLGFNALKQDSVFDDENNDFKLYKHEHIAYRFEILEILGKGSFGQVAKCLDHKTKSVVALKVIKNHQRFRIQAGVEVKVLQDLNKNDPQDSYNIVQMRQNFDFRGHICIVFELLHLNLYDLLRNNNFKGFSLSLIRKFAVQILVGLSFAKRLGIVHCDLKPENILLKHPDKVGLKIIDFGSSCYELEQIYTYIQSRFYRAPEVILGIPYTPAIDMWSFGCILVELYTGDALFQGTSEMEQLQLIIQMRGMPSSYMLEMASRKNKFFTKDGVFKRDIREKKNLDSFVKTADYLFLDLIEKCLDLDFRKRITPELALGHPWIIESFKSRKALSNLNSKARIYL